MQAERTPIYNRIKHFGISRIPALGCADQIICCGNSWTVHYDVNISEPKQVPACKWELTQLHIRFEPINLFTKITLSWPSVSMAVLRHRKPATAGTFYGSVLISAILKGTPYLHDSAVRRKQFWCHNVTTNSLVFFCLCNHINPIKFIITAHCCQNVRAMRKLQFFRKLRQKK